MSCRIIDERPTGRVFVVVDLGRLGEETIQGKTARHEDAAETLRNNLQNGVFTQTTAAPGQPKMAERKLRFPPLEGFGRTWSCHGSS
jgi:hypothetical protein